MKKQMVLVAASLAVLTGVWAVWANEPARPSKEASTKELTLYEKQLQEQFKEFELAMLKLMQQLKRSDNKQDRLRAEALERALKLAHDQGIAGKFDQLVEVLRRQKGSNLPDITKAMTRADDLARSLEALLRTLREDVLAAKVIEQRKHLKQMLERLDGIIHEQKLIQARLDRRGVDPKGLGDDQKPITERTTDLIKDLAKLGEPPQGGMARIQASPPPIGQKQVVEGNQSQKKAQNNLAKGQAGPAANDVEDAVYQLGQARQRIEELLQQLREEELERVLSNLIVRCKKMLEMQIVVHKATTVLEKTILGHSNQTPTQADRTRAVRLSDDQKAIVEEADKAIQMLVAEGSTIAFPDLFEQLRDDLRHVQRRLFITDVGKITQAIELDIIDTLKDMVGALERAQQGSSGKGKIANKSKPGPKQDQKLLDDLAELKLIKSMQTRVNARTKTYGAQYEGEQAQEPAIQAELRNLSQRQGRILEVTKRLTRQDNK